MPSINSAYIQSYNGILIGVEESGDCVYRKLLYCCETLGCNTNRYVKVGLEGGS